MFNIGRPSYLQALVNLFQQKVMHLKVKDFTEIVPIFQMAQKKVQVVHMYFK
jgi:hypothetical protein